MKPKYKRCKCGHDKDSHDSLKKEGDGLGECLNIYYQGGYLKTVCCCKKFEEDDSQSD